MNKQLPPVTVDGEAAIHDVVKEMLQAIADQLHIQVERISVDWHDVSTVHGHAYRVHRVNIVSEKVHL